MHGGSVAMPPDGVIVYSGVGRMDAADSTGRTQWEYPIMNSPVSVDMITKTAGHIPSGNFWLDSAMAIADDSTIYVCATDSRLVANNGADGHFKWEFKAKAHGPHGILGQIGDEWLELRHHDRPNEPRHRRDVDLKVAATK